MRVDAHVQQLWRWVIWHEMGIPVLRMASLEDEYWAERGERPDDLPRAPGQFADWLEMEEGAGRLAAAG